MSGTTFRKWASAIKEFNDMLIQADQILTCINKFFLPPPTSDRYFCTFFFNSVSNMGDFNFTKHKAVLNVPNLSLTFRDNKHSHEHHKFQGFSVKKKF